jgi:hypothetical protein
VTIQCCNRQEHHLLLEVVATWPQERCHSWHNRVKAPFVPFTCEEGEMCAFIFMPLQDSAEAKRTSMKLRLGIAGGLSWSVSTQMKTPQRGGFLNLPRVWEGGGFRAYL